ncbi:response regulator receiver protein [Leptospira ryugenii]|uniref:Response regulator receiver protein n=1 Tax=Leptospira ryugenii TaxID=1917863 RepID=A0A2P2DVA9_9LEPT|nr:response regulator [Leptospira ryugenii]GBF48545.1 response regulator receiver protein [Leptospira ryugenii]
MNYILCVDDDPTALTIQTILFKQLQFGSQTITKRNGQEALDYYEQIVNGARAFVPDLIFLDLNMPILDGWGFLEIFNQKYYKQFPDSKVYILSSSVDPSDKKNAELYPFVQSFISKPLTKESISKIKEGKSPI